MLTLNTHTWLARPSASGTGPCSATAMLAYFFIRAMDEHRSLRSLSTRVLKNAEAVPAVSAAPAGMIRGVLLALALLSSLITLTAAPSP